jgi:hypothetical protein
MLEEDVVIRNVPDFLGVSIFDGVEAPVACDAATDAADPVLEAGVSCPFRPGVTCVVVAAPADEVEESMEEAMVLEEPVVSWLDCVSKLDPVEDPDTGPVVELDTRELETRVVDGAAELDGANWPLVDVEDAEEEGEAEEDEATAAAFDAKPEHR